MRDDNAFYVGDDVVEWTGRADGIEDAQFSFSDIVQMCDRTDVAAQKAEARAKERL